MVKVLLFPLFPSHAVLPCSEEPVQICPAGDAFLVATADGMPSHAADTSSNFFVWSRVFRPCKAWRLPHGLICFVRSLLLALSLLGTLRPRI